MSQNHTFADFRRFDGEIAGISAGKEMKHGALQKKGHQTRRGRCPDGLKEKAVPDEPGLHCLTAMQRKKAVFQL